MRRLIHNYTFIIYACFVILLFISCSVSLLDRNKPRRKFGGLEMAFITLMMFLSVRHGFGNDYEGYHNGFREFTSYSFGLTEFYKWANLQDRGEYGFVILNKLFDSKCI